MNEKQFRMKANGERLICVKGLGNILLCEIGVMD
jgi:hypothetical protein